MKRSLTTRLFRSVFAVSLVTALLSIGAIELFYEDMEDTILSLELTEEQAYFRKHITETGFQQWGTARIHALFLGDGHPETPLPDYLKDRPAPYSAELEVGEKTYLVLIEKVQFPPGRLYLSQDISIMEGRELLSQLTVLSVLLGMIVIGFILSRISARRLTGPLKQLTNQIQATTPSSTMKRLTTDYRDTEFADIAGAFNRFLDALEAFVEREKSFVKLASHELRTPLAVITGALDIIEKRDTLSAADRRTMARIRRAADDMHSDVNVMLKLARGQLGTEQHERVSLLYSIRETIADLESVQADHAGRLIFRQPDKDLTLLTDPALLRMLIRNLLQNALKHTRSAIDITITKVGMRITDYGHGLPHAIVERLGSPLPRHARNMQESSFGLLIVQLICERLDWQLIVLESGEKGTELDICFTGSVAAPSGGRSNAHHQCFQNRVRKTDPDDQQH